MLLNISTCPLSWTCGTLWPLNPDKSVTTLIFHYNIYVWLCRTYFAWEMAPCHPSCCQSFAECHCATDNVHLAMRKRRGLLVRMTSPQPSFLLPHPAPQLLSSPAWIRTLHYKQMQCFPTVIFSCAVARKHKRKMTHTLFLSKEGRESILILFKHQRTWIRTDCWRHQSGNSNYCLSSTQTL